jgi:hypothetical protein
MDRQGTAGAGERHSRRPESSWTALSLLASLRALPLWALSGPPCLHTAQLFLSNDIFLWTVLGDPSPGANADHFLNLKISHCSMQQKRFHFCFSVAKDGSPMN